MTSLLSNDSLVAQWRCGSLLRRWLQVRVLPSEPKEKDYMTITDEEFVLVIKSALTRASVNEIANRLSVSLPSVTRWANNQNLPMPAMRKVVVKELQK
jgi:hypothetical protein